MNFAQLLTEAILHKNSRICIGLDPTFEGKKRIPQFILDENKGNLNDAIFDFNRTIIDSTYDFTPIYKPQIAFYERYNALEALIDTIYYAHTKKCLVVVDTKRNDIGNTSNAYAKAIFSIYKADATTINGYLGSDSILPFIQEPNKGIFVLVKTSNKSSIEYQDKWVLSDYWEKKLVKNEKISIDSNNKMVVNDNSSDRLNLKFIMDLIEESIKSDSKIAESEFLVRNYVAMARLVNRWNKLWVEKWNNKQNSEEYPDSVDNMYYPIGAVVGATFPKQLVSMRRELPNSYILIPGYGAQGGTAEDVVKGFDQKGTGAIVNSSRGINYAYCSEQDGQIFSETEFGEAARSAAMKMRDSINSALSLNVNKK